jgi:hypothetical protein
MMKIVGLSQNGATMIEFMKDVYRSFVRCPYITQTINLGVGYMIRNHYTSQIVHSANYINGEKYGNEVIYHTILDDEIEWNNE